MLFSPEFLREGRALLTTCTHRALSLVSALRVPNVLLIC